ncbi:SAM-dependent methyltransferase [Kocuria tytonicola]|uniref:THUMP-like domain-containing protein n=1 Tax=Kocuria tytonicola TaxID=2055946 RepID=UPI000EF8FB4D|nr:methyltransferase domain-containing protein [Kocuria tytonicola]RLZ03426.1 SAM-dependent methyltransferase [Kocuria tytonicola]
MNSPTEPDDSETRGLARLLTPEGMALLDSLGPYDPDSSLSLSKSLRAQGHDPELVSAALTQSRLRAKARTKFGDFARHMVFTRDGVEQATRWSVAALHAQRFAQAGIRHVVDLGCGVGADSLALAALERTVTAVERDPVTAAAATLNLTGWPGARVVCAAAESLDLAALENGAADGVWLDPARRVTGAGGTRRVFDPEAFSPPLSFVTGLARRGLAVGAKIGPGIPHDHVPEDAEAQWISERGDVVEAVLWFNAVRRPGVARAALVLGHDAAGPGAPASEPTAETGSGTHETGSAANGDTGGGADGNGTSGGDRAASSAAELTSDSWQSPPPEGDLLGPVGRYLYEPDGAVIRAGLVTDLAERLGAHLVHPSIAYLSSDTLVRTPLARAYEVREVLPHTVKVLRRWVKEQDVGTLEIKKRGTDVTPEQLRRQLAPRGTRRATLVMTRLAEAGAERRVVLAVNPLN